MATDCKFLNPLQRDGTSQRQRLAEALDPSFVAVDERDLSDLLNYARRYARLLLYYTPTNSRGGDWVGLVEHDISVLTAKIGAIDTDAARKQLDDKLDAIGAAAPPDKAGAYAELFPLVFDLAETFDEWYRGSIEGLALRGALRRLIGSVLADALREAQSHALRANSVGITVKAAETAKFSDVWGLSEILPDPSLFPSEDPDSEDELVAAVERLAELFDRFFEGLVFVVGKAPSYLQETLDSYPAHQPHMALFLAFLHIFEHAQGHLNGLTAAHLDFYYKEVLGLEHRAAVSDQVHLVFKLAKGFATHKLAEDTALKAGKDATGVALEYATDSELAVNRALVDEAHGLKTVFVEKDAGSGVVKHIYAASDADSADGQGAAIEDEDGKWSTFGGTRMPYAEIGFAIASPMFLLGEGKRVLDLTLSLRSTDILTGKDTADVVEELRHNLLVEASGEKEWLPVAITEVEVALTAGTIPYVRFQLEIGPELGPVVAYDEKALARGFDTGWPVIRILLDNDGLAAGTLDLATAGELVEYSDETLEYARGALVRYQGEVYRAKLKTPDKGFRPVDQPVFWELVESSYPYRYFERMEIGDLDIEVQVDGVRNLVLENDVGQLDPAKPFHPFGPVPRVGSHFLVGSHEVFQKGLTGVTLRWQWADLPVESFFDHYNEYTTDSATSGVPDNQYFKAAPQVLQGGGWIPSSATPVALFDDLGNSSVPSPDNSLSLSGELGGFERDSGLAPLDRFDTGLRQGFLQLELATSFLHREYPARLAEAAILRTTPIPNSPYTPLIASFSLDYDAFESVCYSAMTKDDYEKRVEQLFQIGPFGQREVFPIADDPTAKAVPIARKLVPEFTATVQAADGSTSIQIAEGTLYIGLDELKPPQNLSLLFQVAEGSEDPKATAQDVLWSYLTDSGWIGFKASELIADGTRGLLRSGVVKLAMPKTMTSDAGLLPGGLHWIKAGVVRDSKAVPKLIAIQPQAVTASFRDQGNDPDYLAQPLLAGTIGKLKSREAAVKSVSQPYASFGGRMREADEAFYIRVSERLRHKGRAISIFDYERLVLENFSEVYKVKCINHTSATSEYAPGQVMLVAVPNLRNKNAVDPLQPSLSLNKLEEIRDYLAKLASGFVRVQVANPNYEEVRVDLKVRFQTGLDKGLYTAQLEQDIIRFLSPWLYDDAADLTLGGRIHSSSVLDYVERREYVDFVTAFELYQIREDGVALPVEQAEASSSSAALVAAKTHLIDANVVSCDDQVRTRKTCEGPEPEEDDTSTPSASQAGVPVLPANCERYVGNTRSRELHDLLNQTRYCQIDEIAIDRRYYFSKTADAKAMGYDFCPYCFARGLSKR